MKTLDVKNTEDAVKKVSDVVVIGNPDVWKLICKASSKEQGWMKSTKEMDVPGGKVVQVSTQQGEKVAEALCFVPDQLVGKAIAGVMRKSSLTMNDYQEQARRTSNADMMCCALGLAGESGEVIELIKKATYHSRPYSGIDMANELGDMLWYLSQAAQNLGVTLERIAEMNLEKLRKRHPNGFNNGEV